MYRIITQLREVLGRRNLESHSSLIRGATGSLAIVLFGAGAVFLSHAGLARLLGTHEYGSYTYILAWVAVLALVGRVGMDLASLRFLASYRASGEWALFSGFIGRSRQAVLLASSFVALIAATVAHLLGGLQWHANSLIFVGALLIPAVAMQETLSAQLRSQQRIFSSQLPRYLIIPTAILAGAALLAFANGGSIDAGQALAVALVVHGATLIFLWLRFDNVVSEQAASVKPDRRDRLWLQAGLALLAVAIFQTINVRTDVLMLGFMNGMEDAGIYMATSQTAAITGLGLAAFGLIAAPIISELHTEAKMDELQKVMTMAARGLAAYTLPVAIGSIVFGKHILSLFGSDFSSGHVALTILVIGHVVNSLAGPVGFLAMMTGHQTQAAYILAVSAAANIVLNYWLIPIHGIIGAAVATTIVRILANTALVALVYQRLRINPTIIRFKD